MAFIRSARLRLVLAGSGMMLLQFIMLHELTALLRGFELVILLLLTTWFAGLSLAYALAGRWRSRWTQPLLWIAFVLNLTLPFSVRLLFASLWGIGWRAAIIPPMALMAFLVAIPFSLLLPLAASDGELTLADGYRAEIIGALLGLVALAGLAPVGPIAVLIAYLLVFVGLLMNLTSVRWPVAVAALLVVAYGAAFGSSDQAATARVYRSLYALPAPRLVAEEYTPYQKIDIIENQGVRQLFLNGSCYWNPVDGEDFNTLMAAVPGEMVSRQRGRLHQALVFGSGSLNCPRDLLQYCDSVTSVEVDGAVVSAGLQFLQPDQMLLNARRDGRWQVVIDDARHFLRTTTNQYDLMVTDLLPPVTLQLGALYTSDFYALCARHLEPHGVLSTYLWQHVRLPESTIARSIAASARQSFPYYMMVDQAGIGPTYFYGCRTPDVLSETRLQVAALRRRLMLTVITPQRLPLDDVAPMSADRMSAIILANQLQYRNIYPTWRAAPSPSQ